MKLTQFDAAMVAQLEAKGIQVDPAVKQAIQDGHAVYSMGVEGEYAVPDELLGTEQYALELASVGGQKMARLGRIRIGGKTRRRKTYQLSDPEEAPRPTGAEVKAAKVTRIGGGR